MTRFMPSATRNLLFVALGFFAVTCIFSWQTTAFHQNITLGWTLITAFIKSYALIILLAIFLRVCITDAGNDDTIRQNLWHVIHTLQTVFGVLITLQIGVHLYGLWSELGLYPISLGFWDSFWTLLRYIIGLFGVWMLELWFWLGEELRLSFILNNPCFGDICLEDYPWISLFITALFGYVLKQLWSITPIKWTVTFLTRICLSLIRSVILIIIKRLSHKVQSRMSASSFGRAAKNTFTDVQQLYFLPKDTLLVQQKIQEQKQTAIIKSLSVTQNQKNHE